MRPDLENQSQLREDLEKTTHLITVQILNDSLSEVGYVPKDAGCDDELCRPEIFSAYANVSSKVMGALILAKDARASVEREAIAICDEAHETATRLAKTAATRFKQRLGDAKYREAHLILHANSVCELVVAEILAKEAQERRQKVRGELDQVRELVRNLKAAVEEDQTAD